jgi:hypothetical protein
MANPFFSGRIPQNLHNKVEEYLKESGKAKTDLLIEALGAYLNFPVEIKKTINDSEELWKAIEELQEKVEKLEKESIQNFVIKADNKDNSIKNDYKQISFLENEENKIDEQETTFKKKLLKTNEILLLPGLENINHEKTAQKLRNAKQQKRLPIQIGRYLIGDGGKDPGKPREVLWEILNDNL